MGNDLISRKALLEELKEVMAQFTWKDNGIVLDTLIGVYDMICDQPVAYDMDKVVGQLKNEIELIVRDYPVQGRYIKKSQAIEIVKGGIEK